jgi:hypothetical protein
MNDIQVWRIGGKVLKWAAELFVENPVPVQLHPSPGIEKNLLSHGTACFCW